MSIFQLYEKCNRWILLPPELTYLLYDSLGFKISPDFDLGGIEGVDRTEFRNLDVALKLALKVEQVLYIATE